MIWRLLKKIGFWKMEYASNTGRYFYRAIQYYYITKDGRTIDLFGYVFYPRKSIYFGSYLNVT
jgi:hypothetical protein